jgi:uncharacterized protein (DUF1697 family)
MPRLVAFLRAINVGGHVVAMDELRRLFTAAGLKDVETFIASGNVIFSSRAARLPALEEKIAGRLERALGYPVPTFIRTEAEVAAIAASTPFPDRRMRSAKTFCVGFLAQPLGAAAIRTLMALRSDDDEFHVQGREVFWLSQKKQSESAFSNAVFERTVKVPSTFRGMNTVIRLVAKYGLSLPAGRP